MKTALALAVAFAAAIIPAPPVAAQTPSTVWMTSTLAPHGDGKSADATCTTTAVDPNPPYQTSLTGENNSYKGFGSICIVRTDSGGG